MPNAKKPEVSVAEGRKINEVRSALNAKIGAALGAGFLFSLAGYAIALPFNEVGAKYLFFGSLATLFVCQGYAAYKIYISEKWD
jgi:hypothetical protein